MPVTDSENRVIGVCSGYDLLALDSTPGKLDKSFFPPIDTCINEFGGDRAMMWSNFKNLRQKLKTASSDTVGQARTGRGAVALCTLSLTPASPTSQVMHAAFTISADASMEDAANQVVQARHFWSCIALRRWSLLEGVRVQQCDEARRGA